MLWTTTSGAGRLVPLGALDQQRQLRMHRVPVRIAVEQGQVDGSDSADARAIARSAWSSSRSPACASRVGVEARRRIDGVKDRVARAGGLEHPLP